MKLEVVELIQNLDALQLWIQLNIPSVSEGMDFDASVQGQISETLEAGKRVHSRDVFLLDILTFLFSFTFFRRCNASSGGVF